MQCLYYRHRHLGSASQQSEPHFLKSCGQFTARNCQADRFVPSRLTCRLNTCCHSCGDTIGESHATALLISHLPTTGVISRLPSTAPPQNTSARVPRQEQLQQFVSRACQLPGETVGLSKSVELQLLRAECLWRYRGYSLL